MIFKPKIEQKFYKSRNQKRIFKLLKNMQIKLIAIMLLLCAQLVRTNPCTIRRCYQCRAVVGERLGTGFQQKFCARFLQRKHCCSRLIDNKYGRLF